MASISFHEDATSCPTFPGGDTTTLPQVGSEVMEDEVFHVPRHADMVFVFHHPNYPTSDRDVDVTRGMLKSVISHRSETGFFVELEKQIEEIEKQHNKELEKSLKDRGKDKIHRLLSHKGFGTNMHDARTIVLKDMVRSLPMLGFNVALFTSIDDDELFLCVSLTQPEVIRHYLHVESKELQTTHMVVKKLNVSQDPDDPSSSPPFVRYDQRIVAALQKVGTLDEGGDERDLYRTYHDRDAEGTEGSIMSSRERIRVIQRELTRYLNLEKAKETGFLKDWYPCHSELWLDQLRLTWSSWACMKDMTFVQPIPLLREYFGSQLAFSFAWQGVYCKGLLGLSVVAISIYLVKFGPPFFLGPDYKLLPEKQIMPFSVIVLIWARVMMNLWQREEEYFRCLWNQETIDDQIVRPSFEGIPMKSDVDDNIMEENADRMTAIGKQFISTTVMILCCLFVMIVTGAWVHSHGGHLTMTASFCLSAMVKTFELMYNALSAKLIEMENHKFDQDFHDAWVWQQFMFQAVNSYWPCMSIALSQAISEQCPEIGCFESMRKQVSTLVVILIACSILFLGLERIQVWYDIWSEDRGLERLGVSAKRSVVEEQSKYSVYDMRAQVENMLQLVLGLGFVLLFGTLQPLVAPLCFVHFACAMRCRAVLLTWFTKRSLPHKLQGVGAWSDVMGTLMNFSVFFSGVLIVSWGRFFHGAQMLAKTTGFAAWVMTMAVAWALVDIICPPKSKEAQIMVKRRNYAHRVLITASMGATEQQNGPFQSGSGELGLGLGVPPVDEDTTDPDELRDEYDEERRLSHQSLLAYGTEGVLLSVTDSVSKRTMQFDAGCTVKMMSPQAALVMEEAWDHIPYLGTRDGSGDEGDPARPSLAEQLALAPTPVRVHSTLAPVD